MDSHKKLKNILIQNHLVSYTDQITSCGNHGFTDLHLTNLNKKISDESKYFISLNINNNPHILVHDDLYNLIQEIKEKMILSNYFGGYDRKNNRVLLHYENDGKFRIGNKHIDEKFLIQFDICNLSSLAIRKNYKFFIDILPSKDKHYGIQTLLAYLGISLGFKVILPKSDLTRISNETYSSDIAHKILTINNIKLNTLLEEYKKSINTIDVLWINTITNDVFAAFEVELSKNYDAVLRRFSNITNSHTYLICVGNDYINFKNSFNANIFKTHYASRNINYLTLDLLYAMIKESEKYSDIICPHDLLYKNLIKIFNL